MNIPDREKRRARNIIWNAAREYGFEPPLKVFDPDGRADLYWNSIIGAARRCYGAETVDALFDAIRDADHEEVYEQLLWLGLENAVYQRETPNRPALPALRRRYARQVIARSGPVPTEELPILLEEMHFRRVLGEEVHLMPRERDMLDELELMEAVERVTPRVFAEVTGHEKVMCANVDMYSGLIYQMLDIPPDLFTPLFAVARITGWCAHRMEEVLTGGRLYRPAYKSLTRHREYIPMAARTYRKNPLPAEKRD